MGSYNVILTAFCWQGRGLCSFPLSMGGLSHFFNQECSRSDTAWLWRRGHKKRWNFSVDLWIPELPHKKTGHPKATMLDRPHKCFKIHLLLPRCLIFLWPDAGHVNMPSSPAFKPPQAKMNRRETSSSYWNLPRLQSLEQSRCYSRCCFKPLSWG